MKYMSCTRINAAINFSFVACGNFFHFKLLSKANQTFLFFVNNKNTKTVEVQSSILSLGYCVKARTENNYKKRSCNN